jgi:hypothetical protein
LENNLAKFGYIPDLKVLKYSKSFDIFLGTLPSELLSDKKSGNFDFFCLGQVVLPISFSGWTSLNAKAFLGHSLMMLQ